MGLRVQPQEHFATYTLIYVWYFQLWNLHKIALHHNINITNDKFAPPLWSHISRWKTILTIWQNMMARGQKFQCSNILMNWRKFRIAI